jgi:hypothetical protein
VTDGKKLFEEVEWKSMQRAWIMNRQKGHHVDLRMMENIKTLRQADKQPGASHPPTGCQQHEECAVNCLDT